MVRTWLKQLGKQFSRNARHTGQHSGTTAQLGVEFLEGRDLPSDVLGSVSITAPYGGSGQPAYVAGETLPITVTATNSNGKGYTGNVDFQLWEGLETTNPNWGMPGFVGHQMNDVIFTLSGGVVQSVQVANTSTVLNAANGGVVNGTAYAGLTYAGYTEFTQAGLIPNPAGLTLKAQPYALRITTNEPVNASSGNTLVPVGSYFSVTITAFNADGTIANGYDGKVNLKSNHPNALSPLASNLSATQQSDGSYTYPMTGGALSSAGVPVPAWLYAQTQVNQVLLTAQTWAGGAISANATDVAIKITPPPATTGTDYLVLIQGTYTNGQGVPIPFTVLEPLTASADTTNDAAIADAESQILSSLKHEFGAGTMTIAQAEVKWSGPASSGFPSDMASNPGYWQF